MKVVVGLGNPGSKYDGTRHNLGFDVVEQLGRRWFAPAPKARFDALVAEAQYGAEKVLLVAPQTFMNLSGRTVGQLVKFYQLSVSDLLVICDDLNLKQGQLRLRGSGSAGGQKGLQNILQVLGTEQVPRLRIGIDRPAPPQAVEDYVLGRLRKEELQRIGPAIERAAECVEAWISSGLDAAMNQTNGSSESGR